VQLADIMTKPLPRAVVTRIRDAIMGVRETAMDSTVARGGVQEHEGDSRQ
jgi:hypothetical protein